MEANENDSGSPNTSTPTPTTGTSRSSSRVDKGKEEVEEVGDGITDGETGEFGDTSEGGGPPDGLLDPVAYVLSKGGYSSKQIEEVRLFAETEMDRLIKDAFFEGLEEEDKELEKLRDLSREADDALEAAKAKVGAGEVELELSGQGIKDAETALELAEEEQRRLEGEKAVLEKTLLSGSGAGSSSGTEVSEGEIRRSQVLLDTAKLTAKAALREFDEVVKKAKEKERKATAEVREFRSAEHALREALHTSRKNLGKIRNCKETMARLGGSRVYARERKAKKALELAEMNAKRARAEVVDLDLKSVASESVWKDWIEKREKLVAAERAVLDARDKLRGEQIAEMEAHTKIAEAKAEYNKAKVEADKFAKRLAQREEERQALEKIYEYAKNEQARIAHAARVQREIDEYNRKKAEQREAAAAAAEARRRARSTHS